MTTKWVKSESRYMLPWGPIHDAYCRCPDCKPPLVGAAFAQKIKLLLLAGAVIVGIITAILMK